MLTATSGPREEAEAAAIDRAGDISDSANSAHAKPASRPLHFRIGYPLIDYFGAAGVGSPATTMSWVVGRMNGTHSTVEPSFMVAMTL